MDACIFFQVCYQLVDKITVQNDLSTFGDLVNAVDVIACHESAVLQVYIYLSHNELLILSQTTKIW